jgi:uncharacterized repeat protein (TIGR01451 family)
MSGNHRAAFIILSALLLLALAAPALAQEPLPPRPGSTDLPPRPSFGGGSRGQSSSGRDASSSSAGGGYITLVVSSTNRSGLWAGVEWLDGASNWHRVEGWQNAIPDGGGTQDWWVSQADFGKGPFRWVLYAGDDKSTVLGASEAFTLPASAAAPLQISLALAEPTPAPTDAPTSTPSPAPSATPETSWLSLTVSPEVVQPTETVTITWKVVFTNPTTQMVQGVTVRDKLPSGMSYANSRASQGNVGLVGDTVVANLGDVPPGGRVEIIVEALADGKASPGTLYTNKATYSSSGGDEGTSSEVKVTVGGASLMPVTGALLASPATRICVLVIVLAGVAAFFVRRHARKA